MLVLKLVKPVLTAVLAVGFVVVRKQRNTLKKELSKSKDELREAQIKSVTYAERAQHAEAMLKNVVNKLPALKPAETKPTEVVRSPLPDTIHYPTSKN